MTRTIRIAGLCALVAGSYATGYAVGDLAGGVVEVGRHWWSTAPVVLALTGLGLLLAPAARPDQPPTRDPR